MAIESVAITAGSGTNIAVDSISSNNYQVVKLALGADGAVDTLLDSGQQTSANSVSVVLASDHGSVSTTVAAADNVIGRVKLSDGTDVADILDLSNSNPLTVAIVDGSGDQITSFGGGTQYTEADTDASITGTAMLMEGAGNALVVAQGTASDGLLVNLGSNNDVTVTGTVTVGSHAVTNAGTFAVQVDGNALTALQLIDDVVYVDDADWTDNTSKHALVGGVYQSAPHTVTDGDVTPFLTDANGRLAVSVNGTVTVAAHAVTNAGTFAVQVDGSALTALQLIDNIVHVDDAAFTLGTHSGVMMMGFAGTQSVDANDAAALACTTGGALHVSDAGGSLTVDNGGTFAVQVSSLPASTNTIEVVGDAAHGAAVAGNPVLNGLEGRSTAPTAVDDGDAVRALATLLGKQVVYPFALPANSWSYASPAAVTDTNDDEAKAAVASTRHYITGVQVFNGHDTTGTEVVIKDGSTVMWRGWAEQKGGGCSAAFNPPLRGTANTAVNVANITNSSSTYFNLQGFSSSE